MTVALIYPPSADPTAPYLAVPTLTAWLRQHGIAVLPIDANLECWEALLAPASLTALGEQLEQRLAELDAKPSLSHTEQLDYVALWRARAEAACVPAAIEDALATLRDRSGVRFYSEQAYEQAVATVEAAQRVVSAAHAPLSVDFVAYRTPFSLLDGAEIALDSSPARNPFYDQYVALAQRLRAAQVTLVGLSVAFPGQIQPAYALAHALREHLPGVHITVGGPALTQMLLRLEPSAAKKHEAPGGQRADLDEVLGPFHSAVLFEGEVALLAMAQAVARGEDPAKNGRIIRGSSVGNLAVLPAPDFDGLPLDRYLAPELVLPYDPTRGCYWGVCTFCHYGLAEVGTAAYRERPPETVLDHLQALQAKYGTRVFYLSQDVFSPKIALRIARGIRERGLDLRWGTDMRPEKTLTPEKCAELAAGGQLSAALGVESASPRVLKLIDKGIPPDDVAQADKNLSAAGVAVEAMCFTDFPTETYREAMQSVAFVDELRDDLALFILGRFDLTHGSLVAQKPGEFGIDEVWQVEGDRLGTGLFFAERRPSKTDAQQVKLDRAVAELAGHWRLHRYPWAGALSTAHTMLWYARHGKGVFRTGVRADDAAIPGAQTRTATAHYDVAALAQASDANEAAIWAKLVYEDRRVGREPYQALAQALPHAQPAARRIRYAPDEEPQTVGVATSGRLKLGGRRQSTAPNATKS
ncbi:MAG: radical SAM protein [Deltaproteobacteria bacterium]|nr:radical SAM protein [Deltaproteobacteria bacterium]